MIRMRPKGVVPLEVWDLPVDGRPLQAWRRMPRFASALATVAQQLRDAPPRQWSPQVRERTASIQHIHLVGGGAAEPGLKRELLERGFSVSVAMDPRVATARAVPALDPSTTCVDVGQTSLKLADADGVACLERDLLAAPHRDETTPAAQRVARVATIHFLGKAIARHVRGRPLVLALPCEVSDDGVVAGCTYCWKRSDATLLRELADVAAVDWETLRVLNDAELAAVGAQLDCNVPADRLTLSLTIGFGVGAALLEKSR